MLDGTSGTLDPAFDAHALLVKHWAQAWWESWVDNSDLETAYANVKKKVGEKDYCWNKVAGPTAALWLTMKRAGWIWSSARTACDHLWRTWDFLADPPTAITEAMRWTVRHNRFLAVAEQLPGLIPDRADTVSGLSDNFYVILDFVSALSSLATGKVDKLKDTPEWERKHSASLLSAATGGQWTQTRRTAVRKWGITDSRCQLCFGAPGTVAHRRVCHFNTPAGGWSEIPDRAKLAAKRIGAKRLRLLQDTGMLAIKLPALPDRDYDTFQWGLAPQEVH